MGLPLLYLAERVLQFARDQVADPPELLVPVGIRRRFLEDHLAPLEHGALRDEHNGIPARVLETVLRQKLGEPFDVELVFGDHTAVRRARHGRKHGREPGVPSEDLQDQEPFVGTGGRAQAVRHLIVRVTQVLNPMQ